MMVTVSLNHTLRYATTGPQNKQWSFDTACSIFVSDPDPERRIRIHTYLKVARTTAKDLRLEVALRILSIWAYTNNLPLCVPSPSNTLLTHYGALHSQET